VTTIEDGPMRIAITGHIGLDPGSRGPIYRALGRYLRSLRRPIHGVSCLADGADRIFVNAVLLVGGTFEVVLPVPETPADRGPDPELRELLDLATSVTEVTAPGAAENAYAAANLEMLNRSEALVAVWDSDARGGRGSTAETVTLAQDLGLPVAIVWPAGSRRRAPYLPFDSSNANVLIVS
jgi:hypothetical protein